MNEKSSKVKSCVVGLKELVYGKISDQNDQKLEIFSKDRFSLNIPDYQRPYTWEKKHVKTLLKDVSEQANKNNQKYLLGSLILHKNNENKFNIVDGQQRLTTLALILKVLCENNQEKCNECKIGNFLGESKYSHHESKYHIKENYEHIKTYFESYNEKYKFLTYLLDNIEFICVLAPSEDDAFLFLIVQIQKVKL
ncbi:TPA: DUF262 domain-containing protein [Campylobacter coli]